MAPTPPAVRGAEDLDHALLGGAFGLPRACLLPGEAASSLASDTADTSRYATSRLQLGGALGHDASARGNDFALQARLRESLQEFPSEPNGLLRQMAGRDVEDQTLRRLCARAATLEVASGLLAEADHKVIARRRAGGASLLQRRLRRQRALQATAAFDAWRHFALREVRMRAESAGQQQDPASSNCCSGAEIGFPRTAVMRSMEALIGARHQKVAQLLQAAVLRSWRATVIAAPHAAKRSVAIAAFECFRTGQLTASLRITFFRWLVAAKTPVPDASEFSTGSAAASKQVTREAHGNLEEELAVAKVQAANWRRNLRDSTAHVQTVRTMLQALKTTCVEGAELCSSNGCTGPSLSGAAVAEKFPDSSTQLDELERRQTAVLEELRSAAMLLMDAVGQQDAGEAAPFLQGEVMRSPRSRKRNDAIAQTAAAVSEAEGTVAQLTQRLEEVQMTQATLRSATEGDELMKAVTAAQKGLGSISHAETKLRRRLWNEVRQAEQERNKLSGELAKVRNRASSDAATAARTATGELHFQRERQDQLQAHLREAQRWADYLIGQHQDLAAECLKKARHRAEMEAMTRQVARLVHDRERQLDRLRFSQANSPKPHAASDGLRSPEPFDGSPPEELAGTSQLLSPVNSISAPPGCGGAASERMHEAWAQGFAEPNQATPQIDAAKRGRETGRLEYPRSASVSPEGKPWLQKCGASSSNMPALAQVSGGCGAAPTAQMAFRPSPTNSAQAYAQAAPVMQGPRSVPFMPPSQTAAVAALAYVNIPAPNRRSQASFSPSSRSVSPDARMPMQPMRPVVISNAGQPPRSLSPTTRTGTRPTETHATFAAAAAVRRAGSPVPQRLVPGSGQRQ